jgi:alkanesulfonate monooxygenase SsuD/methylene tetrahydromethanopterin reductase-like flavin-dependent oxidoreductase (luciferase family)
VNNRAGCFTMVNCAPTSEESHAISRESFEWYLHRSAAMVASVPKWIAEMQAELGTYEYLAPVAEMEESIRDVTFDDLLNMQAVVAGDPDDVVRLCKAYESTGADLLLCLVNPYQVSHDAVVQTIELMGRHVIPEFS